MTTATKTEQDESDEAALDETSDEVTDEVTVEGRAPEPAHDADGPAAGHGAADEDDPVVAEEDGDEDGTGHGREAASWPQRLTAPFRRGGTERTLAVVALLGVVGTLVFAGLWIGERRAGQGEAAMEARGEEFLLALTNFDAATVDEDFDRLVDMGTGDFEAEADQFFGSDVREALKEVQASSRGEVRELYVQSFSGDRGRVFGVVDQTIANNRFPQPQADQLRVELTLEHTGGEWQVSDVLVLEAPNAASGAATAAGGAGGSGETPDGAADDGADSGEGG